MFVGCTAFIVEVHPLGGAIGRFYHSSWKHVGVWLPWVVVEGRGGGRRGREGRREREGRGGGALGRRKTTCRSIENSCMSACKMFTNKGKGVQTFY